MPADVISGLFEAVVALVEGIVALVSAAIEGTVTLFELLLEGVFLLVELLFFLIGSARHIGRPDWVLRRRQSAAGRIKSLVVAVLFLAATGYFTFQFFAYTRLSFTQGGIFRPDDVEVLLIRDATFQVAVVAEGKLKVRRGRWDRLVVRDPRYHPADFALTGRRMEVRLERIQTTREAVTGAVVDKAAELLRKKFGKDRQRDTSEDSR